MAGKRELESLQGTVERAPVRPGTGSAHHAAVLVTDGGERLILQRIGGNPFDDAETHALDGCRVRVAGYRLADIFRFTRAERVEP